MQHTSISLPTGSVLSSISFLPIMKIATLLSTFTLLVLVAAKSSIKYSTTPSAIVPWSPVKSPFSVDQSAIYNSTYYVNDRNIAGMHVVNLKANKQITTVGGFFKGVFAPMARYSRSPGQKA
jgi:hypothetical protein